MLFEAFCNYCVVNKENGLDTIDLNELTTGDSAQGIDGIAIIVNGKLVNTTTDVDELILINKYINVKFILIQSKTSDNFKNDEIANFFQYALLYFSDNTEMFETPEMKKFIELKDYIYEKSIHMRNRNPELALYYITLGNYVEDANKAGIIRLHINQFKSTNLFSNIIFIPCGAEKIQEMYRKIQGELTATFRFEKRITMFTNEETEEVGYYGVIPFQEFRKIIIEEEVLRPVFEDNIRDFLGVNNDVNQAIEQTIKIGDANSFCMLNNGITIVAEAAPFSGDTITINNYQIVNGCQTSHILFLNMNNSNINNLMIPIRIIVTKNEELKNSITKATNNQTGIKKEQLEALSTFQKNLEEYYKTYTKENEKLFYERRTGQFRNASVQKSRIITIPIQIKTTTAMFLNNPSGVSGQYGTIAKNVGNKIFKSTDKPILYYTSALSLYRIESLFKSGILEKRFWRARYHAIMLLRIIIAGKELPKFNQRKMETYCKKILDVLNKNEKCIKYFRLIINFIDLQKEAIDLTDRKTFERKETTDYLLNNIDKIIDYVNT